MLTLYVLPPLIEMAHQPVEACRLLRAQHQLASRPAPSMAWLRLYLHGPA